jgi:hypothetical protein
MHTAQVLHAGDFQYRRVGLDSSTVIDFDAFCPHYHMQDRTAVVSPHLEDGILATGCALLALTTAFYDLLRSGAESFYDYPHHFALLDGTDQGVRTRHGRQRLDQATLGSPWGGLDVWPESQWILAPGTVPGMLQTVCNLQINRLFWPEDFRCDQEQVPCLQWYTQGLLRARLKSVYYYNSAAPNVAIGGTPQVAGIIRTSIGRLPPGGAPLADLCARPPETSGAETNFSYVECHRQVEVEAFLDTMASCFLPKP